MPRNMSRPKGGAYRDVGTSGGIGAVSGGRQRGHRPSPPIDPGEGNRNFKTKF